MRVRLLILVVLSVIPEAWLSINDAFMERRFALADLHQEARRFAQFAALQEKETVSSARRFLLAAANQPGIANVSSVSACRSALRGLLRLRPEYSDLHLLRNDGAVVCSAVQEEQVRFSTGGYLREAVATGRFAISDYEFDPGRHSGEMVFAQPVRGASGRVERVLAAAMNMSWLDELWAQSRLPQGTVLSLVDYNGVPFARYPKRADATTAFGDDPRFASAVARGVSTDAEVVSSDGVRRIFSYQPVRGAKSAVYMAVGIPTEYVHRDVRSTFLRKLWFTAASAALALWFAWWGLRRFVLQPLDVLGAAAGRVERGEPGARAGKVSSTVEFEKLTQAFDRMAAGIEAREVRLQAVHRELEHFTHALQALSASNHALLRCESEHGLMEAICRAAVEQGGYCMAWVGWADDDPGKMVRPVASFGDGSGVLAPLDAEGADEGHWRSIADEAVRSGEVCIVADLAQEADVSSPNTSLAGRDCAAVISLPLQVSKQVVGAFTIHAADQQAFTADAVKILKELAADMSFGLDVLRIRNKERQASEALKKTAYYDASTGLPNRAWLRERTDEAIAAGECDRDSIALVLLGVENYREIARTLGVQEGENMLRHLAPDLERIAKQAGGYVARVQSEQFGVLLPAADSAHAVAMARALLLAMETPMGKASGAMYAQSSAGIALFPADAGNASMLLRRAGAALEHARVTACGHALYTRAMDEGVAERLAMTAELKRAIEQRELVLYYQPKVLLSTGAVCGAEALVRWRHPEKGMVPPGAFIPVAERTGLIRPLTRVVLETACEVRRRWREAGIPLPLAVNLSARDLGDPDLLETIGNHFSTCGISSGEIEVEITESTLMDDRTRAQETMSGLHDMGVPIYIDDFGTGHSSLAYIQHLRADAIKIDRSFVCALGQSDIAATIVRSTIALGHDLGMKVVAEGVETSGTFERLAELGCDEAQGYCIARPMPVEAFEAWLSAYRGGR